MSGDVIGHLCHLEERLELYHVSEVFDLFSLAICPVEILHNNSCLVSVAVGLAMVGHIHNFELIPHYRQVFLRDLEAGVAVFADDDPRDAILVEPHLRGQGRCEEATVCAFHSQCHFE